MSPNLLELRKIAETLKVAPEIESNLKVENIRTDDDERKVFEEINELCDELQEFIENIIVTVGSFGVFIQRLRRNEGTKFFANNMAYIEGGDGTSGCRRYPGKSIENIVNASGAGDAFCAGFITAMLKGEPEEICVSVGSQAAFCALMSKRAVPKTFFDLNHSSWSTPAAFHHPNH